MAHGFTPSANLIQEDYLSCKICFELYRTPKLLPCLHSYCQQCLELLVKNSSLQCPECRMQVDVKGGIASLKTNFFLNSLLELFEPKKVKDLICAICSSSKSVIARCLDCNDFLCQSCTQGHCCSRLTLNHKVVNLKEFLEGQHDTEMRQRQEVYCQDHQKEPLRFFCNTCSSAICRDCRLLVHFQHEVGSMADEVQKKKPEVKKLIEGLDNNIKKISDQQQAMKESIELLNVAGDSITESITDYVNKVTAYLLEQKEDALARLSTFQNEQMEKYLSVKQELQSQMDKAVSTKKFSEEVLDVGKDCEIIYLENTMRDRIQELQTFIPQQLENKIPELHIALDQTEILSKPQLFNLVFSVEKPSGDVKTPGIVFSGEDTHEGKPPENAMSLNPTPNIPVVVTHHPRRNNPWYLPRPATNLFCFSRFNIDVVDDDHSDDDFDYDDAYYDDLYDDYDFDYDDEYYDDLDDDDDDFDYDDYLYKPKITAIAAFPGEGGILVADNNNNEIKRFSFNGVLRRTFFITDNASVCSIVICGNTLACTASCYLNFLTLGGNFQHKVKLRGTRADLKYPITNFRSEYVAVSEGALCSVSLYTTKGECIDRVHPYGYKGGRFLFIAINSLENFIVCDFMKKQIVIFKRSGRIVQIMNSYNSMLTKPFSLCVDDSDCILVVDMDEVIQFSADGTKGKVLLRANNRVTKPRLITIDSHGRLVLLFQNCWIRIYDF
ncbi:E3 ubiquitin-protein ligase TRIM56-like [Rhinatrema bivittatum]|uniref:E3 ubiquitin-protein ligase TRIM56-like n=1 Tax=Rhinatrema bivittatum TaxID=194408 RepID=UPI00112D0C67|nr:E3 ubiquitin-protein ligase TRIM56-like [Rhinatrema bivittatum]